MNNKERIKKGVVELMSILSIDRMPTSTEMRNNGYSWLDGIINKDGGILKVAKELGLERKKKDSTRDESYVIEEITKLINYWNYDKMFTRAEVLEKSGHALHNAICRNGGYRYFAEKLNLPLKDNETKLGQDFEYRIIDILEEKGFKVANMSTKHPYDILVNDVVKVDVKVSSLAFDKMGNKIHTFGINKRHASCDMYICVTLDENKEIERILVIPSHHAKIVTLCIGQDSKYNRYNGKFEYIKQYTEFFKSVI